MSRGGKRQGAGRPKGTGKFREPTKAVRLPISQIDTILEFIERKYNGGICNKTAENRNVMDFIMTATEREQFQAVGTSMKTGLFSPVCYNMIAFWRLPSYRKIVPSKRLSKSQRSCGLSILGVDWTIFATRRHAFRNILQRLWRSAFSGLRT